MPLIVPAAGASLAAAGVTAQEGTLMRTGTLEVRAGPPPAGIQLMVNTSGTLESVRGMTEVAFVAAPIEDECVPFHAATEGLLDPVQALAFAIY